MGKKTELRRPTAAEMNILRVIWDCGEATVREVHGVLARSQEIGQTTVLKLMQIMLGKGLLERNTDVRPQVFWAAKPKKQMQNVLVGDLVDSAFSKSPGALVLQALSMRKSTPEELRKVRELLDQIEGEQE